MFQTGVFGALNNFPSLLLPPVPTSLKRGTGIKFRIKIYLQKNNKTDKIKLVLVLVLLNICIYIYIKKGLANVRFLFYLIKCPNFFGTGVVCGFMVIVCS